MCYVCCGHYCLEDVMFVDARDGQKKRSCSEEERPSQGIAHTIVSRDVVFST